MLADRLRAARLAAAREAGAATVVPAGSPAAPLVAGATYPPGFGTATPACFPRLAATVLTLGGKPARSRLREPESRLAQRAADLPEPEAA